MKLYWQIIIAIVLAVVIGASVDANTAIFGITGLSVFSFLGTLFLNALKMLIVPLVMSSIICGVAQLGQGDDIGRLGFKTLAFYFASSLVAILVGLVFVNAIAPGIVDGKPALDVLQLASADAVASKLALVESRGSSDIVEIFLRMVPPNIVAAAANGKMLGLIFFSILFGFFANQLVKEQHQSVVRFFQAVQSIMMLMTNFVMRFAPLGVFGLVAKTVATTGLDVILPMLTFFMTVALALLVHLLVVMSVVLKFVAKVNPVKHYQAMLPALLTAFSTASSSATLPLTLERIEDNAGVSKRTSSFVLPLGATINMDGTALYECVAAMFIAQAYGLELTFATQFLIVTIALLTSIGVAGIPAASLVAISVILSAVGLPLEGIGLLLVTDRLLDMLRTAVNVFSDSCCAVFVARSEGEQTNLI